MKAVNYSDFRQNMKSYLDRTIDEHDPLVITRKHGNMVVLSEEDYRSMEETIYLMSSKTNYNRLVNSMKEAEEGKTVSFSLADLGEVIE